MSGSSDNPHTRAIAQFISQLSYDDIPNEVIERIKLLILDSLGCALYGSALEWSRILRATLAVRHHPRRHLQPAEPDRHRHPASAALCAGEFRPDRHYRFDRLAVPRRPPPAAAIPCHHS